MSVIALWSSSSLMCPLLLRLVLSRKSVTNTGRRRKGMRKAMALWQWAALAWSVETTSTSGPSPSGDRGWSAWVSFLFARDVHFPCWGMQLRKHKTPFKSEPLPLQSSTFGLVYLFSACLSRCLSVSCVCVCVSLSPSLSLVRVRVCVELCGQ